MNRYSTEVTVVPVMSRRLNQLSDVLRGVVWAV